MISNNILKNISENELNKLENILNNKVILSNIINEIKDFTDFNDVWKYIENKGYTISHRVAADNVVERIDKNIEFSIILTLDIRQYLLSYVIGQILLEYNNIESDNFYLDLHVEDLIALYIFYKAEYKNIAYRYNTIKNTPLLKEKFRNIELQDIIDIFENKEVINE